MMYEEDELRCARGIINGLLISIPLWALIIFVGYKLLH